MMELPVINIYCDESCHLENDKHTSMVLGGVSCPISKVRDISVKIKELKEKYGMPKYREIKWVKVSQGKADFYHELLDTVSYTHLRAHETKAIKAVSLMLNSIKPIMNGIIKCTIPCFGRLFSHIKIIIFIWISKIQLAENGLQN